jgi:hypothetical protein
MARAERSPSPQRTQSLEKETGVEVLEQAQTTNEELWIQEYALIKDKSKEELEALNKKVVKKLDWRFLTT